MYMHTSLYVYMSNNTHSVLSVSASFCTFTGLLHLFKVLCCENKKAKHSYENACFSDINALLTLVLQLLVYYKRVVRLSM